MPVAAVAVVTRLLTLVVPEDPEEAVLVAVHRVLPEQMVLPIPAAVASVDSPVTRPAARAAPGSFFTNAQHKGV